jgi:hypothetical protein
MARIQHDREQRRLDEHRWIANLIADAKSEQAQKPISVDEALAENDGLARYGAAQAKKLGDPAQGRRSYHS